MRVVCRFFFCVAVGFHSCRLDHVRVKQQTIQASPFSREAWWNTEFPAIRNTKKKSRRTGHFFTPAENSNLRLRRA
uniref:Putative secreted peptide n=1 Tax=Anopheles braziliensis TaxID=58242 RepID=A0A2M3ZRP0_9DIPT